MAEPNRNYAESDPLHHIPKIQGMFDELIAHLREDIQKIEASKVQAVFETAAEVLIGLKTAFEHYEKGSEAAMREP